MKFLLSVLLDVINCSYIQHPIRCQVTVNSTDGGDPPLDGWCTFRVNVEDINDNRPEFDRTEYSADITSDTQQNEIIVTVKAYDRDIGLDGEILYSLVEDAGIFDVYPANGFIFLKKSLTGVSSQCFVLLDSFLCSTMNGFSNYGLVV